MEQDWGMFEGTGLVKGKILYEKEYEHLQVQPAYRDLKILLMLSIQSNCFNCIVVV